MLSCFGNELPIHQEYCLKSYIKYRRKMSFLCFVFVFLFSVLTCCKIWFVETVSYLEVWTEWPWTGNVCSWLLKILKEKGNWGNQMEVRHVESSGIFWCLVKVQLFCLLYRLVPLLRKWWVVFFFPLSHIYY